LLHKTTDSPPATEEEEEKPRRMLFRVQVSHTLRQQKRGTSLGCCLSIVPADLFPPNVSCAGDNSSFTTYRLVRETKNTLRNLHSPFLEMMTELENISNMREEFEINI
jgi:hypothetical protein